MDADGTNVVQVTRVAGVSDHDPTATSSRSLFERFESPTDYSTDPYALYLPWDIVEARLDGSSERTLFADGWVNWLPVRDPSGKYIAHLRTVGYTDVRLMTKDGRDLGRLIPDLTAIRYLDWK
jgi:Tol biopolymer transport system component